MTGPPELESVSLFPVRLIVAGVVDLERGRHPEVVGGNQLSAPPLAAVEQHLREPGDLLGGQVESPAPEVDAAGALLPAARRESERIEQPGTQIGLQLPAGHSGHDRGEQVARAGIVNEPAARFIRQWRPEKGRTEPNP